MENIEKAQSALCSLIEASLDGDTEKVAKIMHKNEILLSNETDCLISQIIKNAQLNKDEFIETGFSRLRIWLKTARQEFSGAYKPPLKLRRVLEQIDEYMYNFQEKGDVGLLKLIIDKLKKIENTKGFPQYNVNVKCDIYNNLGLSNYYIYLSTGRQKRIKAAYHYLSLVINMLDKENSNYFGTLSNLSIIIRILYESTGNISYLEHALYIASLSLETKNDLSDLPVFLNNYSSLYMEYFERTGDFKILQQACDDFCYVFNQLPYESSKLYIPATNLGMALFKKYNYTNNKADLLEAINFLTIAKHKADKGGADLSGILNNLGIALKNKYILLENQNDLLESIKLIKQAISYCSDSSHEVVMYYHNIGLCLYILYKKTNHYPNKEESLKYFKQGIVSGLNINRSAAFSSLMTLLTLSFLHKDWITLLESYLYFPQLAQHLITTQNFCQHKEFWLKDMQGITTKSAYAFAQLNQPQQATEALEQGQARLLSESLAITRTDLSALQNTEHAHLYQTYQETTQRWHWAQQHKPEELRNIREQLDGIIEQIRAVPDYADFLKPSGWADIELAAKDTPLLYVLATEHGGLALLVQRDAEVQSLWLPNFTETALQEMLQSYLAAYNAWLSADAENHNSAFANWCKALETTTHRLWDVIFAPLQNDLPEAFVLIPAGALNLLPLHAAWTADDSIANGKRYALDNWHIRYVPNARSLHTASSLRVQTRCEKMLAIENPELDENIKYAPHVTANLQQHFPHCTPYNDAQAAHDKVLAALAAYDIINFYCHGKTIPDDPLQSVLVLADKPLTLETLLKADKLNARLVTLCACETGVPGTKLPDEVVSLAAGLLQAGVAGVVSSLWSVADFTTMLLINRFYQLWREDYPEQPAQALRHAQQWVRDSSLADFRAYFQTQMQQGGTAGQVAEALYRHFHSPQAGFAFADPQLRPFAHPFYWAAFNYVGV